MAWQTCRGKIGHGLIVAAIATAPVRGSSGIGHQPHALPGGLWVGGSGYWSWPGNWDSTNTLQLQGSQFAIIDGGNPIASVVFLDVNVSVENLAIDNGDSLHVMPNRRLTLQNAAQSPVVTSAGLLQIDGGHLIVAAGAALVLNGGGRFELNGNGAATVTGENAQSLLYNFDNLIHGAGRIGASSLGLVNAGTIHASEFEMQLVIDPGPFGVNNTGELGAVDGGRLLLRNATVQNIGRLFAGDQSRIELEGATVIGGRLEQDGNGFFRTMDAPSTLQNIINNTEFELGPTRLTLIGHVENNGQINVVAGNTFGPPNDSEGVATSELVVPPGTGDCVLDGNGTLDMHLCTVSSGSTQAAGRLIHGANHTITGEGLLGTNTVGLINHGTIIADSYGSIAIDPPNALPLVNYGSMIATGFGGISVSGATFMNNGVIEVRDASRFIITASVTLQNNVGGILTGGTWRVLADGHPTTLGIWGGTSINTNDADVLLSGVGSFFAPINGLSSNSGRLALRNRRDLNLSSGFLTNSGVLDIGAACLLRVNGLFVQDAPGRLIVEVDGSSGEGFEAAGAATLGGTLEIRVAPRSTILNGQTIEVVRASSVSGLFNQIIAPSGMEVQIGPTGVSVVVHQLCPTDLNGDGAISIHDLLAIIGAWGPCPSVPSACPMDLNGDQHVDVVDLLEVVGTWGSCPS